MMLCLALRSSAEQVYERAVLQFSVEEITEGFAAARGLALPSQLRRALRAEGRDLHGEFLRLLPERPRPIKVQRWTPRRVLIWMAFAVLLFLFCVNVTNLFTNSEATRTPLRVDSIDCTDAEDLEQLWIDAQSVQSATLVPCVASLPVGWSVGNVYANSGRSGFTVDHDRAGRAALEVELTTQCDTRGATEVAPDVDGARRFVAPAAAGDGLDRTWYEVFPGGCTTTPLRSHSSEPAR